MAYRFSAPLWRWKSDSGWHFVTLPVDVADDIEQKSEGMRGGFGSVRVHVTVGATSWSTSLFPHAPEESYLLPMKKQVRNAEELEDGDLVDISLEIVLPRS